MDLERVILPVKKERLLIQVRGEQRVMNGVMNICTEDGSASITENYRRKINMMLSVIMYLENLSMVIK